MEAIGTIDRASAALLVERLTKVYADGTRALDGLQLRIPDGCFFGLLGPNGAGKTTLIGTVSGLVRAPAERIFVFGRDAVTDLATRLLVGVAPQEVHLDRFLTAREVLAYHGRYFGLPKLEAERRSEALCERIAFIRGGRIAAEGTPNELRQRYGGERLEDAYLEAMHS